MKSTRRSKGPWTHRLLVHLFTALFSILIYWLLGFAMRDINTWPGPVYAEVEKRLSDPQLIADTKANQDAIEEATRSIANRKQRQQVLRDSTSNSERTMKQLHDLQKLTLQKGLTPSPNEVKALADSQQLFLTNQTKYQEMNDQVAVLSEELSGLENRKRELQGKLAAQRPAIDREFKQLHSRHQFKVAAAKLGVLVPLLALAVWLFLKRRGTIYAPLIYGFGLAVLVKVAMVMHEHFPTRYFKYILIVIAIALVTRILIYLLRAMAFPKQDWLLKQYREAYEHFLCSVCGHPIRRGPLKYLFWTRSSLKKLHLPNTHDSAADEAYVCPVCATRLFEECSSCHKVRHSLLPACVHCGTEKSILPDSIKPLTTS